MTERRAIIFGAGPSGLTAAYELLKRTDIKPVVYEMTHALGGISRTVNYKGNRIDIGGHRFFSKSDRVMEWWQDMLPLQGAPAIDDLLLDRTVPLPAGSKGPDPEQEDKLMLVRNRVSRIFFLGKFFDYPISFTPATFRNLGWKNLTKIGIRYLQARLFPIRKERSLEDFLINRFGKELYELFFKDYTEKVWGVPCDQIAPSWGAQRIKGLSIARALLHEVRRPWFKNASLEQKDVETSLIEQFAYPKLGPGQMWEEVAHRIRKQGGEIHLGRKVCGVHHEGDRITKVDVLDVDRNRKTSVEGEYFFSTMPIQELIRSLEDGVPDRVRSIAEGLVYRDFITVGLLLRKLKLKNETSIKTLNHLVPDHWIYIQEKDVKIGRLQIYNNWSPYMVGNRDHVWIGLEYFCNEGDELWSKSDPAFIHDAIGELVRIGMIEREDVLDSTLIRVPKTYPAYVGSYDRLPIVREYTDRFENLFLIGRNGMHRYNNQDHSMLTAMVAVDNIVAGETCKANLWEVNAEEQYHE
jgi:protoporphyrinogen oxidase